MSAPSLKPNVALVAEEAAWRRELESSLSRDFNVLKAGSHDEAYTLLEQGALDVLVLDVNPDGKIPAGLNLLKALSAGATSTGWRLYGQLINISWRGSHDTIVVSWAFPSSAIRFRYVDRVNPDGAAAAGRDMLFNVCGTDVATWEEEPTTPKWCRGY